MLKSDVAGSLEAIEDEIAKLPQDEVSVNVIRGAVGAVTESDVMLAAASDAVILAFNVRPVGDARAVAEREGVEIRHYSVIYRAIEELRSAMQGMLAPEEVEETLGTAEVRQIFRASRVGTIAGSHVTEGKITRGSKVRLVRDGTVVYDGEIASLRRFNEDVREVAAGFDCGIVLQGLRRHQGRRRARGLRDPPGRARARLSSADVERSGFVAVLVIDLHFPDAGSLKGKRKELSSIKAQLHAAARRRRRRDRPPGPVAALDADRGAHRRLAGRRCRPRSTTSSGGSSARCPDGVRVERIVPRSRISGDVGRKTSAGRDRMAGGRMRRVDEAVRAVLSERSPTVSGSTRRIRDRDRSQDQPRPAPRSRVRERSRRRADARGEPRGLRSAHGFLQGRVAVRADAQAHADADLRLRRVGRSRDADHASCSTSWQAGADD